MSDLTLTVLVGSLALIVLVVLVLLGLALHLLMKQAQVPTKILHQLLREQTTENQLLRNQLRSSDPQQLAGLNYATLPSTETEHLSSDPIGEPADLGEAINFEELLARKGYTTGDLGHDLESAGWAPAVLRRDGDDPIAYDTTG